MRSHHTFYDEIASICRTDIHYNHSQRILCYYGSVHISKVCTLNYNINYSINEKILLLRLFQF